ncbi:hypothetical protein MCGFDL_MCGFDL_19120, partial [Dysosmobacter welbionis]
AAGNRGRHRIHPGGAEPVFEGGPGREERGGGHAPCGPVRPGGHGKPGQGQRASGVPVQGLSQPDGAHVPAGGPEQLGARHSGPGEPGLPGNGPGKGETGSGRVSGGCPGKDHTGGFPAEPDRRGAVRRDAGAVRRSGPCGKPFCRR